jgi:O-antigen/teichoic acid export membrane protein
MDNPARTPQPTLMQRARRGVFWVGVVSIGGKLLTVASTLVLARVLMPEDFGLMAVAGIVVAAMAIFTDFGVGAAIVHSQADRQRMASTAFFMMPVIGLGLYLLAYLAAPQLASLLGSAESTDLIRIVAITIFIASLAIVPSTLLEKEMRFKRKVVPDLLPIAVYITVTLVLALVYDLGAYSLAFGLVAQSITSLVLNWLVANWRPSLLFDTKIAGELIKYGKNVLGGSVIAFLALNMDNALVSRAAGAAALGYYTMAYAIASLPIVHVADVLGRVLFPSFVQMNQDPDRLRRAYVRALTLLIVVTFPLLFGLAAVAEPFVGLILSDRWLPIVPALQVLIIFVLMRVLAGPTGSLFLATDNTKLILHNGIVGLTIQAIALYLGLYVYDGGITGAAWAIGIAALLNGLYIAYCVHRIFPFSLAKLVSPALRLILPSVAMGSLVFLLVEVLPITVWALILEILAGVVIYVLLLVLLNGRGIITEAMSLLRPARA